MCRVISTLKSQSNGTPMAKREARWTVDTNGASHQVSARMGWVHKASKAASPYSIEIPEKRKISPSWIMCPAHTPAGTKRFLN